MGLRDAVKNVLNLGSNTEDGHATVVKDLGKRLEDSSLYFNKEMGRWVERGMEEDAKAEMAKAQAPPPPPSANPASMGPTTRYAEAGSQLFRTSAPAAPRNTSFPAMGPSFALAHVPPTGAPSIASVEVRHSQPPRQLPLSLEPAESAHSPEPEAPSQMLEHPHQGYIEEPSYFQPSIEASMGQTAESEFYARPESVVSRPSGWHTGDQERISQDIEVYRRKSEYDEDFDSIGDDSLNGDFVSDDTEELLRDVEGSDDLPLPAVCPLISPRLKYCSEVYADLVGGKENTDVLALEEQCRLATEAYDEIKKVLTFVLRQQNLDLVQVLRDFDQR